MAHTTARKIHSDTTGGGLPFTSAQIRITITSDDLALIQNALRAKAEGDAAAARSLGKVAPGSQAGVMAATLIAQAEQGLSLADDLSVVDVCEAIEVKG